jgi:DNA-directed RNA polymerase subunit M/transcription elongation factor TFIIS
MSWDNFCQDQSNYNFLILPNISINKNVALKINKPEPTFMNCKKCNSNLIFIETKQTRRGDEGQTVFCKCYDCGKTWSSSN